LKELGRFLGYLNFYRKFICKFSDVAAPLTGLTKNAVDVPKGLNQAESRKSFDSLKSSFWTAPLLVHFDFGKPRILYVDSSKYALSAVLLQEGDDGKIHPVLFLSKKWNKDEVFWQVHDQDLGAIVQVFVEWRAWLINTNDPVTVMSDHTNLRYFMTSQHLSDRQAQWAAYLSSFHFVIRHIPGKLNPSDPPTRRSNFFPDSDESEAFPRLLLKDAGALKLQASSLDQEDNNIDIGQVVLDSLVPDSDAPPSSLPTLTDTDFGF
jgi:hypothetical protein